MIVLLIIGIIIIVQLRLSGNLARIVKRFQNGNVLVFGRKRKGKDLMFQLVINKRNKPYFSNIDYGGKFNKTSLKDLSVAPNKYKDLIEGTITKIDKDKKREKRDDYISDAGAHLPSQYHGLLDKEYPSMPLYAGIKGHLYDGNSHFNYNGAFTRIWDKVREQADDYFRVITNVKLLPFAIYIKVRHFEEEQAAKFNVLPFNKKGILGDRDAVKAARAQFKSTYGEVKDMWLRIPRRIIKYDTRYFEKVFFKNMPTFVKTMHPYMKAVQSIRSKFMKEKKAVKEVGVKG